MSFYDATVNGAWDSSDPVYVDNDNSGNVTTGDRRVTLQTLGGIEYLPFSIVSTGEPDLGRTLIKFTSETRPSYYMNPDFGMFYYAYLDKYNAGSVSEGDVRLSEVLFPVWWTWIYTWDMDANGFFAFTLNIPSMPGAGTTYNVAIWNGVGPDGVKSGNTVAMQVQATLEVTSAPTTYQLTYYVTEGSDVEIAGTGFLGAEELKIWAGGKTVAIVEPDDDGSFSDE